MTSEEIISGGYLEAYFTGDLESQTMEEIESQLLVNSELRSAFYAIEKKIEYLAFRHGIEPDSSAKQHLMEHPSIMGTYSPGVSSSLGSSSWMSIAASMLALGAMLTSLYFWNQWKTADSQLTVLKKENALIAQNFNKVNLQLDEVKSDIAVLVSPAFSRLVLKGTENAPDAEAVIYWNREEEAVLLNSASLAQLSDDQQYQLWALIDGKPIDAGTFDAKTGQFQTMKNVASADAFAVTIEPTGGSENPTLATMQVYGAS